MLIDACARPGLHGERLPPALAEMRLRRVFTLAATADPDSFDGLRVACRSEPLVVPGLGVHPDRAAMWERRLDAFDERLTDAAFVGVVGLDHSRAAEASTHDAQRRVAEHVLARAAESGLVVNGHLRGAEDAVVRLLRPHAGLRVIVHAYRGPVRAFRRLVDFGVWFSVGVGVLHDDVDRAIAVEIPEERLLVGTESPEGLRRLTGEEGRPSHLIDVQRAVAAARGMPVGAIQDAVQANFTRLIRGDARLEPAWTRAQASYDSV